MTNARGPFSTSDYLFNNAAQVSSGDVFVAAWVYIVTGAFRSIWGVYNSNYNDVFVRLCTTGAGAARMDLKNGVFTSGGAVEASPTPNAWNFLAGLYSPGSQFKAWAGANVTTSATALTWPGGIDRTGIGVGYGLTPGLPNTGYIGPLGVWSSEPSAAEIAAMAGGRDFRQYNVANLLHYYAMRGTAGEQDLVGSFDFSEAGTVPEASGPAIQRLPLRVGANVGLEPGVQTRT